MMINQLDKTSDRIKTLLEINVHCCAESRINPCHFAGQHGIYIISVLSFFIFFWAYGLAYMQVAKFLFFLILSIQQLSSKVCVFFVNCPRII